jgi:Rhodopirellula transposase DDE domain
VIEECLQTLVAPETAGDPMSEQKWLRSSLRPLSQRLATAGHRVSPPTVKRLLRKLGYSLQANRKCREAGASHPDRNRQFEYIEVQRQAFLAAGWPMISVDTKKKELIGDFKNAGQTWCQEATPVNTHDFPQDAMGRAVPYGIYDLQHNSGHVYVGTSGDTPEFAVTAIARWWEEVGQATYPQADHLLILADAGGSNGCRPQVWKTQLQSQLSDRLGLSVTVCHYPTGCSKWNPIEHRLFSHISLNWAGVPLRDWQTLLAYVRGTTTTSGLRVAAHLLNGMFETGQRVTKAVMKQLRLRHHEVCPRWNYTIQPRLQGALAVQT